jgi:UPF0716 protein FxsA
MRFGIFLIFVAVPLIELALLIKIGTEIGFWPTIALVVLTAIVGATVLRQQSLKAMMRLTEALERGEAPVDAVVDGAFLIISGAFLLTPGILTDTVGFALLIPAVRRWLAAWGLKKLLKTGNIHVKTYGGRTGHNPRSAAPPDDRPGAQPYKGADDGPIIEGEYERLDETGGNGAKPRR